MIPRGGRNRSAMMSREVHNGPTDETQARGVPFSGDPQGGAGHEKPPQSVPIMKKNLLAAAAKMMKYSQWR